MTPFIVLAATLTQLAARPVPLRTGIGAAHSAVTTPYRRAQAFYDQGLAYLHSYVWLEAARSFNQAITLDPNLAAAYAQLSIAYVELDDPAAAKDAIALAKALAPKTSERERLWIAARAVQMEAEAAPSDPAKLEAYRAALDRALQKFPNDEELLLARGKAESRDPAERGQGSTASSVPFYTKALAAAPDHFAPHHFLAHAYENTGQTQAALTEAAAYARMAPNVPHARHMHGHELRRTGRIEEAIAEFRAADGLDRAYMTSEGLAPEQDWHFQHNLDLLATSYQYVGRYVEAEALFKQSFALSSSSVEQEFNKREWPTFLIAQGRAQEALDAARALIGHRSALVQATGHIEAGEAYLAMKQVPQAATEYNAALRLMRGAEGAGLLADALRQLQGGLFLRTGRAAEGRAALQQAATEMRAKPGPDAWAQTTFALEAMARDARDAGDWELAEWMARQMIDHDPNYGGSRRAMERVEEHKRRTRR